MSPQSTIESSVERLVSGYIESKSLKPGDRLPSIRRLAEELGLGANVVRDALMQLQSLGVVKVQPRFGVFVQQGFSAPLIDTLSDSLPGMMGREEHNLFHLVDARAVLENETVGLAAAHRRQEDLLPIFQSLQQMGECESDHAGYTDSDERFHLEIARVAGNSVLLTMLRSVMALLRPHKLKGFLPISDLARNRESHQAIYEAIWQGNVETARREMKEHLGLARKSLLRNIGMVPASHSPINELKPAS